MSSFRTRQAPSPTGYLHLGTARTMLFTKLLAMKEQGVYYLRLEDTDRNRLNPEAAVSLVQNLSVLGLSPDEGVNLDGQGTLDSFYHVYQHGKFGPYIQSERVKTYQQYAQELIDKKLAYWSYLSPEDKQELQEIKQATKKAINYFKAVSDQSDEKAMYATVQVALHDSRKPALMYKLQLDDTVECYDELLGKTTFDLNLEEDFVILKSDGYPTYHFAHVIDDHLMQTTVVIRAQEWYASLPKHTKMFEEIWGEVPKYLHLPFILGETGNKKMSKRDGNVNMQEYLDKGFMPEAIINYLAFLGWNPGTEKELYLEANDFATLTQPERIQKLLENIANEFTIETLSKSPARFNLEKLNWFNREYIKLLSLEEFTYLASKCSQSQPFGEGDVRVGDYAYICNSNMTQMYVEDMKTTFPGWSSKFHPLGGRREEGETAELNLKRELSEETDEQIDYKSAMSVEVYTHNSVFKSPSIEDERSWVGKQMHINLMITNSNLEEAQADGFPTRWIPIEDVIASGYEFLNYPIWSHFCKQNNLTLFEPNRIINQQYLAWNLDKNRVTVLSELGAESDCILNYTKPTAEEVTWKKSTPEESKQNLNELVDWLMNEEDTVHWFGAQNVEEYVAFSTALETKVKMWLSENKKDTGSYLWPLRVALSGKQKSPSPFELLSILSKEQILERVSGLFS